MLNLSEINIEELNDTYYRMVDLIGLEDTVKLANNLCGRTVGFSKTGYLSHECLEIIELIGEAKFKKLHQGFFGENHVYFSSLRKATKSQRYAKIRQECNGYNYKELAKKYGYSDRHIRSIVTTNRKDCV